MMCVALLGVFRIEDIDNRYLSELGPGGRGLASFFTYPGRPQRRERLADLFWPEFDADRARRALNSALWRLRKMLAAIPENNGRRILKTVGHETVLEHAPWLDIDAAALQDIANLVLKQPSFLNEPHDIQHITSVLHRYRGPFLDGDDGDWVLEERERLHSLFLRTATVVVRHLGAAAQYHDAIRLARHALCFDPYREELVRTLLILFSLDERRHEAVQYYRSWTKSLKADIDILPMPATQRVLDEIKEAQSMEQFGALRTRLTSLRV
jgi:DNA-binding SARP family transcriptional activator